MNDPYLSDPRCVGRLVDEYYRHGSLVVAFDIDNTLFDFHGKGHKYPALIRILKKCRQLGFYLICFTADEDTDRVKDRLKQIEVPFDSINENPPFFKSKSRKIYYNILLDDRAGLSAAYWQLEQTILAIEDPVPH